MCGRYSFSTEQPDEKMTTLRMFLRFWTSNSAKKEKPAGALRGVSTGREGTMFLLYGGHACVTM